MENKTFSIRDNATGGDEGNGKVRESLAVKGCRGVQYDGAMRGDQEVRVMKSNPEARGRSCQIRSSFSTSRHHEIRVYTFTLNTSYPG